MAGHDLRAAKARTAVSMAGIALGICVLLIIAALGLGARDLVLKEVVRQLPLDMVEVVSKTVDLGLFKINAGGLLGSAKLDANTLEKLRRLPHVIAAYPTIEVDLPLGAEGGDSLFGHRLHTDMFMNGLPEELLKEEIGNDLIGNDSYIPVIISDQLIEVYNSSVAPTVGGPKLTSATLKGFTFDLIIGRSMMLGARGAKRIGVERARIIGVSRYAMRFGVTVPLTSARRILQKYAIDPSENYTSILLKADSVAAVSDITAAVKTVGLAVNETAERTSNILIIATALASLVGLLVLALAALNIAHSFFASLSERRRELAIMRATGARQRDLLAIVLTQAIILGLGGAIVGCITSKIITIIIDNSVRMLLPNLPFMPPSFFVMPPILFILAIIAAIVAALLGALWPALRAAHMPVSQALADN